jgi:tetrahydromethanopterin S-methyltransferase subunit G
MANEPDNLVLIQLREIRASHTERFNHIDERFDRIEKRLDEMDRRFEDFHSVASHALMLGTATSARQRELEQRQGFSEGEHRSLRERVDELERRIAKVEEDRDH